MKSPRDLIRQVCAVSILLLAFLSSSALAEKWSFAAIGDNRKAFSSYRNVLQEIRDQEVREAQESADTDFVLAVGDIAPVARNYEIYKEVFKSKMPAFFPVRGNHEKPRDVNFILKNILPSHGNMIHSRSDDGINYYADWKNVRIIVLDQYSDFGKSLDREQTLQWIEDAIRAVKGAKHVFISFHEPYLPGEPGRSSFWDMLLRHKDTVRAVLCGHYHYYDRQRVPNEQDGIDYINVGNAGQVSHSDNRQTIVRVMIDDRKVTFRVIQAPDGAIGFRLRHQWEAGETYR